MGIDRSSGQPDEEPDRPREEPRPDAPADHRESVQVQPETRFRQEYYDVLASARGYEIVGFAALMAERPASERYEWQIPAEPG
jgi:hypothetical protein